jgi:hypothetical protein
MDIVFVRLLTFQFASFLLLGDGFRDVKSEFLHEFGVVVVVVINFGFQVSEFLLINFPHFPRLLLFLLQVLYYFLLPLQCILPLFFVCPLAGDSLVLVLLVPGLGVFGVLSYLLL